LDAEVDGVPLPGNIHRLYVLEKFHPRNGEDSMFAVIKTGGKQFRAEPGARIRVPTLAVEPGDDIVFDEVLLTSDGDEVRVGTPVVEGARVTAEVVKHGRDKKVIVFKRKRRKGYRKKQGHRQGFTEIRVSEVKV
jgi:large subunit ribosomal protein L21